MVTSGLIHYVLNALHITVHIRDVCVFLAPTFRYAIQEIKESEGKWERGGGVWWGKEEESGGGRERSVGGERGEG